MAHRIDELAKALAQGVSRREALRRIGGGLAGMLLSSMGLQSAWGQRCPTGQTPCGGHCCGVHETCCPGARGRPYCANLESDPRNCGACGNVCPRAEPYCLGNTCTSCSEKRQTPCGEACCPPGYYCCNPVMSICALEGDFCIQ